MLLQGRVVCNGKGINDVSVTDGINICRTDANGMYKLQSTKQTPFVYFSSPSGYEVPVKLSVPQFFRVIPKNVSATLKNDFELKKMTHDDNKHGFIVWVDPQVARPEQIAPMKDVVNDLHDFLKENKSVPFHAMGCGDIISDNHAFFYTTRQALATLGIPFYQSIGNHDIDFYGKLNEVASKSYEARFGPTYYSFNRGKIHYVVLNDVFYIGRDYFYIGYLTGQQLDWLEQDLKYVRKGSTVVVCFHIPSALDQSDIKTFSYSNISTSLTNKKGLYDLLMPFNTHIISGHLHSNINVSVKPNIMEHIHSSVCGAWWQGTVATDGTPKGYGVFKVDGDSISWFFKSLGKDKSYQFKQYPLGANPEQPDYITVNVWNWDSKWKVYWYEDGVKIGEMENYKGLDPQSVTEYSNTDKLVYKWIKSGTTDHLFRFKPSSKSAKIKIEVVDRFGTTYTSTL
ncbi:MAG: calcineurin-like phosphoesterase family protein [Bacteroidota bacterium]|nr:calcineurin-like phosphoesterase family protein [Bacteroidota bacterium]